jgi:hypothetical protein
MVESCSNGVVRVATRSIKIKRGLGYTAFMAAPPAQYRASSIRMLSRLRISIGTRTRWIDG